MAMPRKRRKVKGKVTPIQNMRQMKPRKRLFQRLNESIRQKTFKSQKGLTPKKVDHILAHILKKELDLIKEKEKYDEDTTVDVVHLRTGLFRILKAVKADLELNYLGENMSRIKRS